MKYENLANNLKLYRKKVGLTQKELGQKILKSEISIRKYESGNVNIPPASLLDICEVLGVDSETLLGCDSKKYGMKNLDSALKESISIAEDTTKLAIDWITKVRNIQSDSNYLLDTILRYLANTEKYISPIFPYLPDGNNANVPNFTEAQTNDIVKKITDLVKYEIYRIETNSNRNK